MYDINHMIYEITNDHIKELLAILEVAISERDERSTRTPFRGELPELSEEAYWLFNFIMWLNKKQENIKITEEALFYHLPRATKNNVFFSEFVDIVKNYRHKRNTDQDLVKFMTQLTKRFQTFYMNMITGYYRENITTRVLTKYLDTRLIKAEDIYSEVVVGREAEFPAGVRFIPEGNLEPVFFERTALRKNPKFYVYYQHDGKLERESLPNNFMKFDNKTIRVPSFFMYGFIDIENEKFYPLDYFCSKAEYKACSFSNRFNNYKERIQRLNQFLSSTILKGINPDPVVFAEKPLDVLESINPDTATTGSKLILCDGVQRINSIDMLEVEGVVGGIVYDNGRPYGFEGWFNCEPLPVIANLTGKNNALITSFDLVKGKHMKFLLMETEGMRMGIFKEVLWDKVPFRMFPLEFDDGRVMYIEKCIICGNDEKHKDRGICKTSEIMMHYFWKIYGPDNWFPIFTHKTKHRMLRTHWKETMINAVGYIFKGHRLIARAEDDGTYSAMFMSDPETMKKHLEQIEFRGGVNEFYTVNQKTGKVFNFDGSYARKTVRRNGSDEPLHNPES